jgi:hypothetical protein
MDKKVIRNKAGLYAVMYTVFGFIFSFLILIVAARLSPTIGALFIFLAEFDYNFGFKIGFLSLLVISYLLGKKAYFEIREKHRNKYLICYIYGVFTIFISSLVYNITRLILYDNVVDLDFQSIYIFVCRPIFIGLILGLPSIILFGTLFARQLSRWTTE